MSNTEIRKLKNIDMLKMALSEIKDEEFAYVPHEEMTSLEPSESFKSTIIAKSSERKSLLYRFINSSAKKVAVIAAISLISVGGIMSVEAIREPVVEFICTAFEKTASLFNNEGNNKPPVVSETEENSADDSETDIIPIFPIYPETTDNSTNDKADKENDRLTDTDETTSETSNADVETQPYTENCETQNAELSSHTHEFVMVKTSRPTCTEDGFTEYICRKCGEEKHEKVPSLGHSYRRLLVNYSTCLFEGNEIYGCTRCGHRYQNILPITDHKIIEEVYDATCTEEGSVCMVCDTCGEIFEKRDVTPPLGHNYVEYDRIEPNCIKEGCIVYKCTRCSSSYSEVLEKSEEHDFEKLVVKSCTSEGYTKYTCKNCGFKEKRDFVPAPGHCFEVWKIIAPTTENEGYTIYKCSVCYKTEKGDYIPPLGSD